MAEIMEEDTELPNSNEAIGAGNSFNGKDSIGPIMPMDFVPTGPPPAPSTNFIKPKPKQRKSKTKGQSLKKLSPLLLNHTNFHQSSRNSKNPVLSCLNTQPQNLERAWLPTKMR
ncbi:hypothetical protein SLA2020_042620 [Shorea laevis]